MRLAMATRPRARFAHKQTVRLMVDDDMFVDALGIVKALPDFQDEIIGVMPLFGGKCFDITLRSVEAASRLAVAGFDYENTTKSLRLLGAKTLHVSIFISVEFPDSELKNILKQYGQLKSDKLRRLHFQEDGFQHIERGIRVAEFLSLDRDLPRKMVTQGLEIFFKYTGQPITCYRCGSTDHMVRDCPKRRPPNTQFVPDEPEQEEQDEQDEHDDEQSDSEFSDMEFFETPTPDTASQSTTKSPTDVPSVPPTNPTSDKSTAPTPVQPTSQTSTNSSQSSYAAAVSRELFSEPDDPPTKPATRKRPPSSPPRPNKPSTKKRVTPSDTFLRTFTIAIKNKGPERDILRPHLTDKEFIDMRALFHHQQFGHYEDLTPAQKADKEKKLAKPVIAAWNALKKQPRQDSYKSLVELARDLEIQTPTLFDSIAH